ncbi:MAG: glycoside hydrolase N-terminal domain-containing protein [Ferruginibacter sp.]
MPAFTQPKPQHNLQFDSLAKRWDEAIPLGNGWLGALIWQKGNKLRMSLDRVDLWDDRPMPEIDKLKFDWVKEKVRLNQYDSVQKIGDEPYEKYAAPTKIPGAAIEINMASFGKVTSSTLDIKTAIATIKWNSGIEMESYVSAVSNNGIFILKNVTGDLGIDLIPPSYNSGKEGTTGNSVEGIGLERLGYKKGNLIKGKRVLQYFQPCYGSMAYVVNVSLEYLPHEIRGNWRIDILDTKKLNSSAESFDTTKASHLKWWND